MKTSFKSLNQIFSVWEIYKFITFLKAEILFLNKQFLLDFTTGNGRESVNLGENVLSDVVMFSILSSDIPLDFHE